MDIDYSRVLGPGALGPWGPGAALEPLGLCTADLLAHPRHSCSFIISGRATPPSTPFPACVKPLSSMVPRPAIRPPVAIALQPVWCFTPSRAKPSRCRPPASTRPPTWLRRCAAEAMRRSHAASKPSTQASALLIRTYPEPASVSPHPVPHPPLHRAQHLT